MTGTKRRRKPDAESNPFAPEAVAGFSEWLRSQTPEELAERLTAYEPGIPHFWHGQPVAPITKEDLLALRDDVDKTVKTS